MVLADCIEYDSVAMQERLMLQTGGGPRKCTWHQSKSQTISVLSCQYFYSNPTGWSFNGNHLCNNAFTLTAPWPIDKSIWICHDRDYFIFCITNCNPNIKFTTFTSNDLLAHLCKCLEMQQVMTHHRCSEIIKADFDLAHTLLHKGNKSSDSHFSENVHQIGCRML